MTLPIAQTLFEHRYSCISHEDMTSLFKTARKACFIAAAIFTVILSIEKGAALLLLAIVLDITLNIDERRAQETQVIQNTLIGRANAINTSSLELTETLNQFQAQSRTLSSTTTSYKQTADTIALLTDTLNGLVTTYEQAVNRLVTHSLQNPA